MRWWSVFLSLVVVLLVPGWARGARQDCVKCHHLEIKAYAHPPYLSRRCDECHLRVEIGSTRPGVPTQGVKWWREVEIAAGEYYLPLPGRMARLPLVVTSREPEFQKLLSPDLVSRVGAPEREKFVLKRIYPCDEVQGVSISVELCMEAGWPFEAEVECGKGIRGFAEGYGTLQRVWIDGLRPGTYRCRVRAQFLGDGEAEKEISFDTHLVETVRFPRAAAGDQLEAEIREVEGVRYLYLQAPARVVFRVGYLPVKPAEVKRKIRDEAHRELRPPAEVATDACYRCHTKHSLGASHPVDVVYNPGDGKVRQKPELPLFGGKVACASCHEPHTSNRPYLLRKQGKELCLSCHLPRYF
ncbi:MAG TPA: hypothetical protein ENJ40_08015 [Thermosulfurimonas dismutans]|uniref:Doubled CXXCH motif domain-containing protein n=1 Tax=Thermosulfurimonas dismutans TaxID=999894 RepID=A0A7C3GTR1_9BACT|nr:hypothetical protein [Thermosulfurimonas dismutans]